MLTLIVAGGRDYWLGRQDFAKLDALHAEHNVVEEVCGGANGADACGKVWAILNGIPIRDFPADWKLHGRTAGFLRNEDMATYAAHLGRGAVALFPGNSGTRHMHATALRHRLRIFDFR